MKMGGRTKSPNVHDALPPTIAPNWSLLGELGGFVVVVLMKSSELLLHGAIWVNHQNIPSERIQI